ncbi:MAG TPA: ABC transporter substrate-binding protein [Acidimicrobiales bacterium]|nr:ABC transporter substrate-binding protein [Acidimicrobiales bacterium]
MALAFFGVALLAVQGPNTATAARPLISTVGRATAGAPVRGGTLTFLGGSDIINLDTVSAYYPASYILERMFTRQLFGYPDAGDFAAQTVAVPDVATEVPTTANGGISDGGRTYTVHIKPGVMWDTSPPRQVTSDDFVREFKMLCNPVSPVAVPGYFETTIEGMQSYCNGFAQVSDTVSAIDRYEEATPLPGVAAPDPSTIVFKLIEPSSDFLNILAQGFCSARPVEYMKYLPDSAAFRQHTLSDGPYRITSYSPGEGFTLERNPVWEQSTDTLRHAYVDKVVITEGLTTDSVQEQLEAGTGDLEFFVFPPPQDLPGLERSPDLVIGPPNGYIAARLLALNEYSGPFKNQLVREAAEYAVDKNAIVQLDGGPRIATVAGQPILPGNTGYIPGYDPFPDDNGNGDPSRARALLAQAGYPHGVTITLVYPTTPAMQLVAESLQSSLGAAGFRVGFLPVTQAAFFGSYLENPSTAKRDVWDIAAPRWDPDWLGNNGRATLEPLFTNPGNGSPDYGGYSSPVTDATIAKALATPNAAIGASLWSQAERQILADAATVPVDFEKWPIYHASAVHGCVFWWYDLNCDPTNVWLSSNQSG